MAIKSNSIFSNTTKSNNNILILFDFHSMILCRMVQLNISIHYTQLAQKIAVSISNWIQKSHKSKEAIRRCPQNQRVRPTKFPPNILNTQNQNPKLTINSPKVHSSTHTLTSHTAV